jgi:acetyl-CoA carboxylase biotin carboxyl carrier protein
MNIKEIKQLVKLMVDNALTELDIESGSTKVSIKRAAGDDTPVVTVSPRGDTGAKVTRVPAKAAKEPPQESTDDLVEIKSPMVGTLYTAASPDSEIYVSVGDTVNANTVVCIVEAMKVMNEIKAECSGSIVEICAKNAQPVEFGQVLYRVKPS